MYCENEYQQKYIYYLASNSWVCLQTHYYDFCLGLFNNRV